MFSFKEYNQFLLRKSDPGGGFGILKKPLYRRYLNEQKGSTVMSRENLFLYLSTIAFEDRIDQKEMKEEIFELLAILMTWYCEPIEESNPPPE